MNILYVENGEIRTVRGTAKDVPTGVEFWALANSEIPSNRDLRDAWVWDADRPADGVGL